MKGFLEFVREQGVVGLAVGFILGGSVSKVVSSIVGDLVNPILGIVMGSAGELRDMHWTVGGSTVRWGNFLATLMDFLVISTVVYVFVKKLKLDRLDKKKG